MSGFVHPSSEQFEALTGLEPDQPVIMLNLLRFADEAPAESPAAGMSGRQAYAEYARRVVALDGIFTGTVLERAGHLANVIGPVDERWDELIVVRYETVTEFIAMATNPEYLEVARWRTAALADSRLAAFRGLPA